MVQKGVVLSLFLIVFIGATFAKPQTTYPHFKQCDPRWGNDTMGVPGPGERSTICGEGCAMTSAAMLLNGMGVTIPGTQDLVNPQNLNAYLINNSLYECLKGDCNNLILAAPEVLTPQLLLDGEYKPTSAQDVINGLTDDTYAYLAHVHNGHHFVLLTGVSSSAPNTFLANDPNYNTTEYSFAEISDLIVYRKFKSPSISVIPKNYPLFKQCDQRWGSDIMVTTTVCKVGCLMSSISMSINGHNITIPNEGVSNPGTLNSFLRNNQGYDQNNDLEESAIPKIAPSLISWPADGMHPHNDLSKDTIRAYLVRGRVVIANVMQGHHFVLVTGWRSEDEDLFTVNDPGFERSNYSYTGDIVGWRIFDMQQA